MDLNQSRAVGGNILGPFQGSLTNVETSGRLQSQIQVILGQILTFPDPPWLGRVDLGRVSKSYGLRETVSCNSYMTPGLYGYSLAQPAILPPAQHMRGTSNTGSFNLSLPKRIFDE